MSTTNRATNEGTATVVENNKCNYLGQKVGVRVSIVAKTSEEAIAVRATLMAAERFTGASPTPVLKNGKYKTWHQTYSQDAGYLWGRSTGWMVAAYEVQS